MLFPLLAGMPFNPMLAVAIGAGAVAAHKGERGSRNANVAQTILQQLGGSGRLSAMIGAKRFEDHGNALGFRFPNRGAGKPNYVKITLTGRDDYDIEFGRIRGYDYKVIKTVEGVYVSNLRETIEDATGLYLSLGTMGR